MRDQEDLRKRERALPLISQSVVGSTHI